MQFLYYPGERKGLVSSVFPEVWSKLMDIYKKNKNLKKHFLQILMCKEMRPNIHPITLGMMQGLSQSGGRSRINSRVLSADSLRKPKRARVILHS